MSNCCQLGCGKCDKDSRRLRYLSKCTKWVWQVLALTALLTLSLWVAFRQNQPASYLTEAKIIHNHVAGVDGIKFSIEIRNQDLYKELHIENLYLRVGKLDGDKFTHTFPESDLKSVRSGGTFKLPLTQFFFQTKTSNDVDRDPDWDYYLFQLISRIQFGGVNQKPIQLMQSAHVYFNSTEGAIMDEGRGLRFIQGSGYV